MDDIEIPTDQINPVERENSLAPDHQGDEEVAEHGGNGRNQEKEHHDHSVQW